MLRPITMIAVCIAVCAAPAPARPPDTWDGLTRVSAKKVENLYLLPNADFRTYSRIMLDPSVFSVSKDWVSDYNDSSPGSYISDQDVRDKLLQAAQDFDKIFAKTFAKGDVPIVTAPGPGVLRLSFYVLNIRVTAPDNSAAMVRTFSPDAGQATFAVEARDSMTGQLLGRAVDSQEAGSTGGYMRTAASNWADFEDLFEGWAKISANALDQLKARSPIDANGVPTGASRK